jgi:chromosome segregation ATPase
MMLLINYKTLYYVIRFMLLKNQGLGMGRIGIAYQDVAQAARYCQGVNQAPTVDNIRQHLKTGSKSTIARYLREWKENSGMEKIDDAKIPGELQQLVGGLWERLQTHADGRIEQHQLEAKAAIQSLQQQLAQAQREKRELEVHCHRLEEQHHQNVQIKQQVQAQLTTEQQKNNLLTERLATYETRHQEQVAESERLHQLLKNMQQNLEHYQNSMQQLRQEQLLNQEKLQQEYEQRITYFQQQFTVLTQEKLNYQAQYEQTKPLYDSLQNQYEILNKEKQDIHAQHQTLICAHQSLKIAHEHATHQTQELAEQLAAKTKMTIDLEIALKSQEHKMHLLESAMSKNEDKVEILRQDYDGMVKEKALLEAQFNQIYGAQR